QENLNLGLLTASRTISSKAQLPILSNVLLKATKEGLQILATNLEMGVNIKIGAKIEEEGEITIPAKIFTEIISSLSAERIDLQTEENILKITTNSYQASLNGLPATEFPKFPSYVSENLFSLPAEKLLEAINQVAFAAATDDSRPILTGILFELEGKNLSLVATDGYRLSFKRIEVSPVEEKISLIIPARSLIEVSRILEEDKEKKEKRLKMGFTREQNQVVFVFPEMELFSRVIEGTFPDYQKIIPASFASKMVLDRENLAREVKVVSVFARDSANIIRFKIQKNLLEMSANSPQIGENKSSLEAKQEGEEGDIAFNFRFLQSFLSAVNAQEISLETNGPLNPGVFRAVGDDSFLHIIMPVRLQSE
ncbi:MAG: DNA polymerase III subunit beta, partial [Microgenomates group bacterium]